MRILITGATGFIGRPLCVELTKQGHELLIVTRNPERHSPSWGLPSLFLKWDMEREICPISLQEIDAVVHLAGESIAGGLWTQKQKSKILHSRTKTCEALGEALRRRSSPLPCLISASAIGIYPNSKAETFDERSPHGTGFLAEVCEAWENAVKALPQVTREVRLRLGLVVGQGGGLLQKQILPTRLGLGAVLGDGQQWMSWVHRDDVINAVATALKDTRYHGPIDVVAPQPVMQKEFQQTLANLLSRPVVLKVPRLLLEKTLGEFSQLLLGSQKVAPSRLQELGFTFRYPTLGPALAESLNLQTQRDRLLYCQRLEAVQFIPRPVEEIFEFFANPHNLERITPPMLQFRIEAMEDKTIREGSIIQYRLRVHGLPMRWKTKIVKWTQNEVFIDNQERGPYTIWHHTHRFHRVHGGTLMTDVVKYRLPLGIWGESMALPLVKRDIRQIFDYRRKVMMAEFKTP